MKDDEELTDEEAEIEAFISTLDRIERRMWELERAEDIDAEAYDRARDEVNDER